eukprot:CAMPEP_0171260304 /NCGR_PEP_ID=MMETSP0790-20130122/55383_1 /TAXON_ID=2925 /ORGANISM="Alexandrium catenella, Strain OF101" /LENGTH=324 /DNA_ID=CAMNT_0011728623 /DNA_START=91 /DNA_END=1065 /DNA_ORIENTATION=+
MAGRNAGRTASTVGMMEGAFFVSRTDLLQWVNSLLQTSLAKVEQCAGGAVYCQILDACHPGTVAMRRVNWMAKTDHEFVPNYKVLQAAFDRNGIERHIDVDKLIRAKYQDNLEFLQWMKCYYDREGGCRDYEPLQAREGKPLPPWAQALGSPPVSIGGKENLRPRPTSGRTEADAAKRAPAGGRPVVAKPSAARAAGGAAGSSSPRVGAGSGEASPKQGRVVEELSAKLQAQAEEIQDLRAALEGLESERDYYFKKLRDVEVLCAANEANMPPDLTAGKVLKDVQAILYAGNDGDADAEGEEPLEPAEPGQELLGGPELVEQAA